MIVQLLLSPSFCITAHLKAWMKTAIKNYWKSVLWINLKNNFKSVKFYFCKYGTNKKNLDFDVLLFPIFFVAITVMLHKPALTPTQWYTQKNVLPFKLRVFNMLNGYNECLHNLNKCKQWTNWKYWSKSQHERCSLSSLILLSPK